MIVAAYLNLGGDGSDTVGTSSKKKKRPAASKTAEAFLPEDYEFNKEGKQFTLLNEPMRNAFKPLVARATDGPERLISDIGVPVAEPNWIYTGMAEIDGVPTALLENTRTGDGVFLKQGESWKGVRVYKIAPEELVVTLADGVSRTVKINAPAEQPMLAAPGGGFQPVNPPIRGPIGREGLAVQPDGSADTNRGRNSRRNAPPVEEGIGVGDEN